MKIVTTLNAPQPAGHYSQAVIHENLVFVSGQLPIYPDTGEKVLGSIEEQTSRVLNNIKAILEASNSSLNQVLKVTVYVSDITLWDRVNRIYSDFFGNHRPARAVVPTKDLHHGFQVEMEVMAYVKD